MLGIYRREWKKLIKHPAVFWGIALFILFLIYCYVSVGFQFQKSFALFLENGSYSEQETLNYLAKSDFTEPLAAKLYVLSPSMALTYSLAAVNSLGPIILSIIGALLFGVEYRHFTIRQLWVSGMTRKEVLMGKVFSLSTFILLFIGISVLVGYIMSVITPILFNLPMEVISEEPLMFKSSILQIVGTIISLLLWGIFAACITVITKSILVGMIAGFLYPIIESTFLHSWSFGQWFPLFIQKSMLPILFEKTAYGGIVSFYAMPDIYSINQSILYTLIYILFFVFIMFFVLKKQKTPMP
ncbi:ABC transporter permease subunit [Lysinibacillus agricola]|uniref:ABC transporter permease subunit n=1 Tax=Lysinibacillus agricola TaxID=2590012 RepID=A0ABX7AUD6_9BACI|nr:MULTISPECIES: ABC transporter permease subunit [Lysinibacillus]KOS61099.1 hypothetical protein AN161_19135 [Lysinibacillus sp. FJAT-14222]QQP12528.1 ABC transporter permease subunit [Lysinibacillus agricola]